MYPSSFRAEGAEQASLQPTITNTNTNFACFHGHGAPETSSFIHTPLPSKATSSPSLWGWEGGTRQLHPLTNRFCYSGEEEEGKKKKRYFCFFILFTPFSFAWVLLPIPCGCWWKRCDVIKVQTSSTGSTVAQPAATSITLVSPGQCEQNGAIFSDKYWNRSQLSPVLGLAWECMTLVDQPHQRLAQVHLGSMTASANHMPMASTAKGAAQARWDWRKVGGTLPGTSQGQRGKKKSQASTKSTNELHHS